MTTRDAVPTKIKERGQVPNMRQVTQHDGDTDYPVSFGGPFIYKDASGVTDWSPWEFDGCVRRVAGTTEMYYGGVWIPFGVVSTDGLVQAIEATYNSSGGVSIATIPSGARVLRVWNEVQVATTTGTAPTITVSVNGATPLEIMGATDSDFEISDTYLVEAIVDVAAANAGVVSVSVSGSPSDGSGRVVVEYAIPRI